MTSSFTFQHSLKFSGRNSLVVQRLGLGTFIATGPYSVLGGELRPCNPGSMTKKKKKKFNGTFVMSLELLHFWCPGIQSCKGHTYVELEHRLLTCLTRSDITRVHFSFPSLISASISYKLEIQHIMLSVGLEVYGASCEVCMYPDMPVYLKACTTYHHSS